MTDFSAVMPQINSPITEAQAREMNPVVLAFIGDAVQTLTVRSALAVSGSAKAGSLHRQTSGEVNARHQAQLVAALEAKLTEAETAIYHRGRNSHTANTAKNATVGEYRMATGFEAVIGYLYLTGQTERLTELLNDGNTEE